jgi:hypothetical protein
MAIFSASKIRIVHGVAACGPQPVKVRNLLFFCETGR